MNFTTKLSSHKLSVLMRKSPKERDKDAVKLAELMNARLHDVYGIKTYVRVETELDGTIHWNIGFNGLLSEIKAIAQELSK